MTYSITEAKQFAEQHMPVYAKKSIPIFGSIYDTNPAKHIPKGYVGEVWGYQTKGGKIYFKIDDTNIYLNGQYFYVLADKTTIATNEYDVSEIETQEEENSGIIPNIFSQSDNKIIGTITKLAFGIAGIYALTKIVQTMIKTKSTDK